MTTEAWTQLGAGMAFAFFAFMQRYNAKKAESDRAKLQERVKATEVAAVETKVVAEKVHEFVTNGTLGHVKNALAIASRALAELSKKPEHDIAAAEAEMDYATHKLKEKKDQLVAESAKEKSTP